MEYLVSYDIMVDADNPRQAAEIAYQKMTSGDGIDPELTVRCDDGSTLIFDLS